MKTIIQNKNRLLSGSSLSESENKPDLQSLLWHIALHDIVSEIDTDLLKNLTPQNCSLFVIKNNQIIFQSNSLSTSFEQIQEEINFLYEATYAQQIFSKHEGLRRVMTIPLTDNLLFGLVAPAGMEMITEIEDAFMHKSYKIQKEYKTILDNLKEFESNIKSNNPSIIINRNDEQIIGWNNQTLLFFDISQEDIIETKLKELSKYTPKSSQRKMKIKNCTIANTDFSIVQYSLHKSDILNSDSLIVELINHTETLIKLYQNLLDQKPMKRKDITLLIEDIKISRDDLQKLQQNSEKNNLKIYRNHNASKHENTNS